ncbi:sigma factor-like helix-turn-helix DNA-binding protein [Mucilaginibacter gotjawali]
MVRVTCEKEVQSIIDNEISLMPKGMREMFEMSRKKYMSHKDIAQELGLSEDDRRQVIIESVYVQLCF